MAELQVIPARHGTATFVPAGQTIKIINTSGTQVIDTWAFALPKPEKKGEEPQKDGQQEGKDESTQDASKQDSQKQDASKSTPAKKKASGMNLPSQADAEKATQEGMQNGQDAGKSETPQKRTWGSYVPSIGLKSSAPKDAQQKTEQQEDSKTWSSYMPSGKGFSNYLPKSQAASDTVSSFAKSHQRDPDKTYMEQLQQFSKTPVGAAGLAVISGSGYGGSIWSGYQAWSAQNAADAPPMEYMSMTHTRSATLHLRPKVNDTLVSNLREPILTMIEDTSPGIHDTLIAACDPPRYKGLGVDKWEEHGSCAENLVLALNELNERAGLKGPKGVGADVTINSVPAPLNLFMNIPWDAEGDIGFHAPKCKADDYVRLKAERDVVVVMSACPQDILDINNKNPTDAHFIVEEEEQAKAVKRSMPVRKRPPPRKISSSHATSTQGTETGIPASKRPVPQKRTAPPQKKAASAAPAAGAKTTAAQSSSTPQPAKTQAAPARKKPVPKPVTPQKKKAASEKVSTDAAGDSATPTAADTANGPAAAPVERKKPRKLNPKPKAEAPAET